MHRDWNVVFQAMCDLFVSAKLPATWLYSSTKSRKVAARSCPKLDKAGKMRKMPGDPLLTKNTSCCDDISSGYSNLLLRISQALTYKRNTFLNSSKIRTHLDIIAALIQSTMKWAAHF